MKKIFTLFAALTCMVSMYAATETVYFVNADKWSGTINAYAWSGSTTNKGWPGVAATKEADQIGGCDVYSYTAEAGTYTNVIFNNKVGDNGKQTTDLTWTAGKYYVRDNWYSKDEVEDVLGKPVEVKYYVVGQFNGWTNPDPANVMTVEEGVYKKTINLPAGENPLKVTNGTWDDGSTWGVSDINGSYAEIKGGENNNIVITLTQAKSVTIKFDAEAKKISFDGLTATEATPATYVLMGVGGDWTTGIAMTVNPNNDKEYMLIGQVISEGDAVKVVTLTNGTATAWCGDVEDGSVAVEYDDMGNIVLTPGKYDFYYKVDVNKVYIGTSSSTAVDNVTVEEVKAVKVIRNGQLYILRDGVLYNAIGQIAE